MKLIVISPPSVVSNEHQIVNSLFENGLEIFHIHKPDFSKQESNNFIQQIPSKYYNQIALHSAFPKFHSIQELQGSPPEGGSWGGASYAFLSPIFDSISKREYKSKFLNVKSELISAISGKNIIALGGIDEDKIEICRARGFSGVAVLGAIWNSTNPVEKFKRIKYLCSAK
jgi:hypothetical protein